MPASPRKRRKSYNVRGHAHFLTFSCYRRWPMLNRDRSRRGVIEAIDAARNALNLAVWAYVIMPEHLHLLIYPRSAPYEMKDILTALKRPVSDAGAESVSVHKAYRRTVAGVASFDVELLRQFHAPIEAHL